MLHAQVEGLDGCTLGEQGYAMGYAEGVLTAQRIWDAFQNFNNSNGYLEQGQLPPILLDYITAQNNWMETQIAATLPSDPLYSYWQHVGILLQHALGVGQGYASVAPASQALTPEQVYILAMAGDLEDLSSAIPYLNGSWTQARASRTPHDDTPVKSRRNAKPSFVPIHMDCSGLVKLTDEDLFVGHSKLRLRVQSLIQFDCSLAQPHSTRTGACFVCSSTTREPSRALTLQRRLFPFLRGLVTHGHMCVF